MNTSATSTGSHFHHPSLASLTPIPRCSDLQGLQEHHPDLIFIQGSWLVSENYLGIYKPFTILLFLCTIKIVEIFLERAVIFRYIYLGKDG